MSLRNMASDEEEERPAQQEPPDANIRRVATLSKQAKVQQFYNRYTQVGLVVFGLTAAGSLGWGLLAVRFAAKVVMQQSYRTGAVLASLCKALVPHRPCYVADLEGTILSSCSPWFIFCTFFLLCVFFNRFVILHGSLRRDAGSVAKNSTKY